MIFKSTSGSTTASKSAWLAASALAVLLSVSPAQAQAAPGATGIDASGQASAELAACNNGKTQQDRATCIREVNNAQADKRAGNIAAPGADVAAANALRRCDALAGEDKIACRARVAGYGSAKGSVAGGGVITEVETVVVPAGATSVTIEPKTSADNIIVIPAPQ